KLELVFGALADLGPRHARRDVFEQAPAQAALVAGTLDEHEADVEELLGSEASFFLERFEERERGIPMELDEELERRLPPLPRRFELRQSETEFVLGFEDGKFFQRRQERGRFFIFFPFDEPCAGAREPIVDELSVGALERVQERALNPLFGLDRRFEPLPK